MHMRKVVARLCIDSIRVGKTHRDRISQTTASMWLSASLLLIVLSLVTPVSASETLYHFAAVPPEHVNRISCGTNEFPPFGYAAPDGGAQGIEVDVMHEVGRRLGIHIDITILPWPRMLSMMRTGQLDCMFAAFYTEERNEYMQFTRVPLHVSRLAVYVHKESDVSFARLEDLRGLRLGMIRDFRTVPALDALLDEGDFATLVTAASFRALFEMLAVQRIDAVIVNHTVAKHVLAALPDSPVIELPNALSANSAFVSFTRAKSFDSLVPKIDYALFEIIADGTYARYFSRERQSKNLLNDPLPIPCGQVRNQGMHQPCRSFSKTPLEPPQ